MGVISSYISNGTGDFAKSGAIGVITLLIIVFGILFVVGYIIAEHQKKKKMFPQRVGIMETAGGRVSPNIKYVRAKENKDPITGQLTGYLDLEKQVSGFWQLPITSKKIDDKTYLFLKDEFGIPRGIDGIIYDALANNVFLSVSPTSVIQMGRELDNMFKEVHKHGGQDWGEILKKITAIVAIIAVAVVLLFFTNKYFESLADQRADSQANRDMLNVAVTQGTDFQNYLKAFNSVMLPKNISNQINYQYYLNTENSTQGVANV